MIMNVIGPLLAIVAFIAIPSLIYAFFCLLPPCPPLHRPLSWRQQRGNQSSATPEDDTMKAGVVKVMSTIKYMKKEGNQNECPVCLSFFIEEEEIKELSTCKHTFHGVCIDKWLNSDHASCPVCRVTIPLPGKRPKARPVVDDGDDFRQGLPDASSLV